MSVQSDDLTLNRRIDSLTRLVTVGIILSVLAAAVLAVWAGRQTFWQLWGVTIALAAFALLSGASLAVNRVWRRPVLAAWLFVSSFGTMLLAANVMIAGVGRPSAIALLALTWIAGWLVVEKGRGRFIIAGMPFILLLVVGDFFRIIPYRIQLNLPALNNVFIGIGLTLALGAIVLILRNLNRLSLRNKLVAVFLIIIPIPMAVLGFANGQVTTDALTQDARRNLSSAAEETARLLDQFISEELAQVRLESEILGSYDFFNGVRSDEAEGDVQDLLLRFRARDPINIASYAVLDLIGNVVLTTTQDEIDTSEAGFLHVTEAFDSGRAYMSPLIFETPERAYFYFSHPIFDANGNTVFLLRIKYRAEVWQEIIASRTGVLGGESFAVLFDENYLHLGHGAAQEAVFRLTVPLPEDEFSALQEAGRVPDLPQDAIADDLYDLERNLDLVGSRSIFEATDLATGDRVNEVAASTMNTQPWLVAYFQPQDVLLAPVDAQARNTFLLTLLMVGVVTLATGSVAQLLTRPIVRLTETATRFGEGDLEVRAAVDSEDEIGVLAETFNTMVNRLTATLEGLENRVAERTLALRLSSEVSRRLSNILDQDQLVREVVEQVRSAFDFYHVHIYLLDRESGRLNMAGGTGRAGQTMLDRGHFLTMGQGLVGRAAQQNEPVLVPDVELDPGWVRNELLPETRSELAVPIVSAGEVLGVLDVQSNRVGGLDREDVSILQSISDQIGTALRNARSFEVAQRQAQQEALINEITQQIRTTDSVDDALQVAVRALGEALSARQTQVRLRPERFQVDEFVTTATTVTGDLAPNGNGVGTRHAGGAEESDRA